MSDIPEAEQTLLKFYETAILAESQRSHYQETNEKAGILDASSGISVNKFESRSNRWQPRKQWPGNKQQQQQQSQNQDATDARFKQNDAKNVASTFKDSDKKGQQQNNDNKNSKQKKRPVTCFNCGVIGHTIYKCDKFKPLKEVTKTHNYFSIR